MALIRIHFARRIFVLQYHWGVLREQVPKRSIELVQDLTCLLPAVSVDDLAGQQVLAFLRPNQLLAVVAVSVQVPVPDHQSLFSNHFAPSEK
jgi:hypothetical protein